MNRNSGISGEQVTVVVPVHNREHLLCRCLDSIAAQTVRPSRVIVVDNASVDSSLRVAEEWAARHRSPDFRVEVVTEPRRGATLARNRGLAMVDSEYVLFFDSDDAMRPHLVERALETIQGRDIVYWKALEIEEHASAHVKKFSSRSPLRAHFFCGVLCTVCFMARTSLVRDVGGWCSEASVWNDWELGIRMLLERPRLKAIDEILTDKYPQRESITGTAFNHKAGEWERTLDIVERVVAERASENGFAEARLRGMTDYRRAVLAAHYRRESCPALAHSLMADTLRNSMLPTWKKWLLRAVYRYTSLGGRGAYLLWH